LAVVQAWFHTHPNPGIAGASGPRPFGEDIDRADYPKRNPTGAPVFVISKEGVYVYDPKDKSTKNGVKVMDYEEWKKPCS
jgi:hypothetical protein